MEGRENPGNVTANRGVSRDRRAAANFREGSRPEICATSRNPADPVDHGRGTARPHMSILPLELWTASASSPNHFVGAFLLAGLPLLPRGPSFPFPSFSTWGALQNEKRQPRLQQGQSPRPSGGVAISSAGRRGSAFKIDIESGGPPFAFSAFCFFLDSASAIAVIVVALSPCRPAVYF